MITNIDDPGVQNKVQDIAREHDIVHHVVDALTNSEYEFRVYPDASGFEFGATNEVKGAPNRALMKLFFPAGKKMVGVFYKKSSVLYSRDRFSYGGVQITPAHIGAADIGGWLTYLHSGLHPEHRPAKLQRTLPYTLPEN